VKKTILFLFLIVLIFSQETGVISGFIKDSGTKEQLISVNISVVGTKLGTVSDDKGMFRITGVEAGSYKLQFDYVGYDKRIVPDIVVYPSKISEISIELTESIFKDDIVEVSASYFESSKAEPISVTSFSPEEIRRSPGAGGELSRILNALPSVASRGEDSQDLMVRGGSPSENIFLIDNIVVPSVKHFETSTGHSNGPIGIINTNLINDVQFYSGAFNSQFGSALSSVTDISYKDGNTEQLDFELGMDFTGFSGLVEGPLFGEKGSAFLSVRRSYLDIIANAINAGGAPRFEDIQSKFTYKIDEKNKISLLNIYAKSSFDQTNLEDAIEEDVNDLLYVENVSFTTGINWFKLYNSAAYGNTSLSYSTRKYDLDITSFSNIQTTGNSDKYDYLNFRHNSVFNLSKKFNLNVGFEFKTEKADFNFFFAEDTLSSGIKLDRIERKEATEVMETAMFTGFNYRLTKQLLLNLGARINYHSFNKDYNIAPRFKMIYNYNPVLTFNIAASRHFQKISSFLAIQSQRNKELKSMQADHFIVGMDYLLSPDTKFTLELFRKNYNHMPIKRLISGQYDPSFPIDVRFGERLDNLTDNGEARSHGIELFLQKKLAVDFYGMLSASFFRSEYKDQYGEWQSRQFDNKYLFSVIGGYKPNNEWEFSLRWSFIGGKPETPIDVIASKAIGTEIRDMTKFHDERLKDYHSLFIRVDKRFYYKKSAIVAYLTLWNAYNNKNVNGNFWNKSKEKIVQDTGFSLLPVVGIKYEF
jgi:outer membrane receptor for ferrienterochelin and colicin